MKIRTKVTLWYISISVVILLFFSTSTYLGMRYLLLNKLDAELTFIANNIQNSYDPTSHTYKSSILNQKKITGYSKYHLIIYDTQGNVVYISEMAKRITLKVLLEKKEEKWNTTKLKVGNRSPFLHPDEKGMVPFRVMSRKMKHGNTDIGRVVVGIDLDEFYDSMRGLLRALLAAKVFAGLFMWIGGYWITKNALLPVKKITRKAELISHSNLNDRIEISNKNDELGHLTSVLNDLLTRLQNAFESQQQFLADAAHELKSPLALLRVHWESEIDNPELTLEIKEQLVQDVETITRLSHLVNNLLLLSQTESIESNFEFTTLNLHELLEEVVSDVEILAESKSQGIHFKETSKINITGDKTRLYQLFFNLLENASKYTQEKGEISVSLSAENNSTLVEIRDNGEGIPADDLPNIFKRFYRVHKDRSRKTGGSGLGLSICKVIAEAHKGSVEVESKTGKGSTFTVRLPVTTSV